MVVTDTEPERLAPLPRQRQWASAGFAWWQRAIAPTRWRGVSRFESRRPSQAVVSNSGSTAAPARGETCSQSGRAVEGRNVDLVLSDSLDCKAVGKDRFSLGPLSLGPRPSSLGPRNACRRPPDQASDPSGGGSSRPPSPSAGSQSKVPSPLDLSAQLKCRNHSKVSPSNKCGLWPTPRINFILVSAKCFVSRSQKHCLILTSMAMAPCIEPYKPHSKRCTRSDCRDEKQTGGDCSRCICVKKARPPGAFVSVRTPNENRGQNNRGFKKTRFS